MTEAEKRALLDDMMTISTEELEAAGRVYDNELAKALERNRELEAAIRDITCNDAGHICNSYQDHVDLGLQQPILRTVWDLDL